MPRVDANELDELINDNESRREQRRMKKKMVDGVQEQQKKQPNKTASPK